MNKELPTLAADYQRSLASAPDASEEERKTKSLYQYDGNKGCLIAVTLIPVGTHLNRLRLPELTEDELLELLGPVIKLDRVEAGVEVLTPLTMQNRLNDLSQQQFRLSCYCSKEAHFVSIQIGTFYLMGPTGEFFHLDAVRLSSPDDRDRSPVGLPPRVDTPQ